MLSLRVNLNICCALTCLLTQAAALAEDKIPASPATVPTTASAVTPSIATPHSAAEKSFWEGPFFWQTKPEIMKRMQEKRYIPTSVISTDDPRIWWMKGAGIVKAPADFTYEYARDFKQLEKIRDHFEEVSWNADKTELHLVPKVLTKKSSMRLKLWEEKNDKTKAKLLHYKVTEGSFTGAEGVLIVTPLSSVPNSTATAETARQECLVEIISKYEGNFAAFGNSMLSIAVEAALQHVASSLRSGVESAYENPGPHPDPKASKE